MKLSTPLLFMSLDADDSIMDSQLLDSSVEPAVSPPALQQDKKTTNQLKKCQYYQGKEMAISNFDRTVFTLPMFRCF